LEASAEPPEVKRTGRNWLDMLLALTAIFVSVSSLFLAYNSSNSMERLVQANSMPFIQLGSGNATDDGTPGVMAFSVRNAGSGPARVHTFSFTVDGEEIAREGYVVANVVRACCADDLEAAIARDDGVTAAAIGNDLTTPIANSFFGPGDEAGPWAWRRSETNAALWDAVDQARQRGRIGMRACYCSLFDECWIAETRVFPPRSVASCTEPAPQTAAPSP
jgi:hypothetical protein